jgi:hypothetical protein
MAHEGSMSSEVDMSRESNKKCGGCGLEVEADARYCGHCGAVVVAEDPCPKCGHHAEPPTPFCTSCGWRNGTGHEADKRFGNRVRALFGFRVGRLYEPDEDFGTRPQHRKDAEIRSLLIGKEQSLRKAQAQRGTPFTKKEKDLVEDLRTEQRQHFIRGEELTRENFLKRLRPRLGRRREMLLGWSNVLALIGGVVLVVALGVLTYGAHRFAAVLGALAALSLVYLFRQRLRETTEQMVEIDNELDRFKIEQQGGERRAQKLFQLHSVELKR